MSSATFNYFRVLKSLFIFSSAINWVKNLTPVTTKTFAKWNTGMSGQDLAHLPLPIPLTSLPALPLYPHPILSLSCSRFPTVYVRPQRFEEEDEAAEVDRIWRLRLQDGG